MNRAWRVWLRSVPGQLSLLGGAFFGAAVLAVVIACLRGPLFERYVRETYPPLEGWAEEAARTLASPRASRADLRRLRRELNERLEAEPADGRPPLVLERIYGGWMQEPEPQGLLAVRLTRLQPDWVVERLRRTLVAGRPEQRGRALEWMSMVAAEPEVADRIVPLARYAHHRAARRGEEDLRRQAAEVLERGGHTP